MQFKQYPSYKNSGVEWLGDVPEHWDLKRFKYILEELNELSELGDETLLSVSEYYGVKPRKETIRVIVKSGVWHSGRFLC